MICFTVAEKLDRELFTTSILFTFFQTFPGRFERDVTMARHIEISFANISYSAQAQVYDSLLVWVFIVTLEAHGFGYEAMAFVLRLQCSNN